ncbi:MAG: pitrilysin family protein [Desulfoferrobacter sp.]
MTNKYLTGLLIIFLSLGFAIMARAVELSGRFSAIPAKMQSSVKQVLSSKPDDLFVVLNNGLTVLMHHADTSDVVSAQVFVRAGSLYEGKSMTAGLSHYLEHVVSGGSTDSFTEAEAKKRLQAIGGETNAYTSYDRTVYFINTSADNWKDALDLLISYVSESKLDPQEVAREKAVIQQEYKLRENNPDSELWNLFMKTAYQVHPVRNPVIGYEEVFVQQDRQDLLDYYSRRYQPENIIVSVAGNIDPIKVLQFIVEKTRNFKRKAAEPTALPAEPAQLNPRWEQAESSIARMTKVLLGFPSVSMHEQDLYALDVLAFLLGQGDTSRLYQRLKDKENKVLSVTSSNWTPSFVNGQFVISLDLPPKNWPQVLGEIKDEIDRFRKDTVDTEDLEKAKKTAIAQHIFGKETVSAMASSLASSYFDTGDPYFDETYLEGLRGVSREQIRDVARRYLDTSRMNVSIIQPPMEDTSIEKSITSSQAPSQVKYHKLGNDLRVLLKPDSSLPMVTVQLYGLGGLLLEAGQPAGISAFTSSLLTAGTVERSKLDIAKAIEDVGGSIQSGSNNNTYYVTIKVLKDDLDLALNILSDILRNSQFSEQEIEKKRIETLLEIQTLDENWQIEIFRLFKKNYFQNSPYGHERLGTADSVKELTREQLVAFYHKMVNPHSSVLAVYGDFAPEKVFTEIQTKLSGWNPKPSLPKTWPTETEPLKSNRTVEKKNEKTSAALFIGTDGLGLDSRSRPVLDVLNTILSGAGSPSGRLFEGLRGGKEDLVYVVGSFPFYGKDAGYFGVITQTTMANLEKVESIILHNLERLQQERVSDEELKIAKNMLLTAHRMGLESLTARAQSAAVNEALGLGWDYDQKYTKLVKEVEAKQIQDLAKELFAHTLTIKTMPENPVEALPVPHPANDVKMQ